MIESERRAVAALAAAICPAGTWPRHLVIIDDLHDILQPGGVIATWSVRSDEVDPLNKSPLFRTCFDRGVSSFIYMRRHGNLIFVAVALGKAGTA
jgi:hypothetical protein